MLRGKEIALNLVLTASILFATGLSLSAQSLEEKRDKKLQLPFLKKAVWITDFDKAREEAKKSGKAIFGYFTRSYSP
jgi:hypothetical protein